jgi:hypothetical protein
MRLYDNSNALWCACVISVVFLIVIAVCFTSARHKEIEIVRICSTEPATPICESLAQPDTSRWLAQECYRKGGFVEWDTNSKQFKRCNK